MGNHEFDNGVEGLAPFLENSTFPILSANIDASEVPLINGEFFPSTVLEVNGHEIGVVGYTTTETPEIVNPGEKNIFSVIFSVCFLLFNIFL